MSPPDNHDHDDDWGSNPFATSSSSRAPQLYPDFLRSSYDHSNMEYDGYDLVYHSGTHPSTDPSTETTSLTSLSQLQENIDSFPPDSSQATICPLPQGDDFKFFNGPADSDPQWNKKPDNLDNEFGIPTDSFQAFQMASDVQRALDPSTTRAMMGISSSMDLSLQQRPYEDDMKQVQTLWSNLTSGYGCGQEEFMKAYRGLVSLKAFFDSKLPNNPPSTPSESNPRDRGSSFQCILCKAQDKTVLIGSFGSLKRHLASIHDIFDKRFFCPIRGCRRETFERRDRLREHLALIHAIDPTRSYVDKARRKVDPPRTCPICDRRTQSWDQYFEHIKHHCSVSPGPASVSTGDDRSRRGGNGGGGNGGNRPNHNPPSFAEPSNANGQSGFYQDSQPSDTRNFLHPESQRGHMKNARTDTRPSSLVHSISDNQLDLGRRHGLDHAVEDHPMMTSFENLCNPDLDMTGGIDQQSGPIQPLQDPSFLQPDQSGPKPKRLQRGKRSNRPRAPIEPTTEQQPPSSRECTVCGHNFERCQQCQHLTEPINGCHKCTNGTGARIQTLLADPFVQSRQNEFSPTGALNEQSFQPFFPEGYVWLPQGPSQEPFHHSNYPTEYTGQYPGSGYQRRSFDSTGTGYSDDVSPGGTMIRAAMVAEDHGLVHSLDPKILQLPTVREDLRLLYDIGLGSLMKSKSPQGQFKQAISKAFGISPEPYTGLPLKTHGPSILGSPQPVPQCQCPCAILPGATYKAHLRAQLSPCERVEMTFNMTPASRESNHPLRTRVKVVVRLLRLRASVSKSNAKRKRRKQSIESEATSEDDAGSETDSDHALSPTSPSGSDDVPVVLWTEDVQDWSFDFDLKWAISKFAEWTSGINADTYLKIFHAEPGHILDLISLYIMYSYKQLWLLRVVGLDSLLRRLMIS
ncbi:unnamed protein product [Penicillium salamii]|uniref:C2H2-type domain-containing protein n=1 Tax=Penicillium salamii TaxID=1612424 RepID=A0A9W4IHV4_9EURO|nr:unnamed protein product [Penicillium salamii]CAG8082720.1 unnamed protein product [Penicillium salamii]CAG8099597.1 unnamed protein product [Penicillium salamii]CAG8106735.1 unnamed protein product [Penicillium salamii]CAG8115827.1 unnamed protein product [Penicillium salamii]